MHDGPARSRSPAAGSRCSLGFVFLHSRRVPDRGLLGLPLVGLICKPPPSHTQTPSTQPASEGRDRPRRGSMGRWGAEGKGWLDSKVAKRFERDRQIDSVTRRDPSPVFIITTSLPVPPWFVDDRPNKQLTLRGFPFHDPVPQHRRRRRKRGARAAGATGWGCRCYWGDESGGGGERGSYHPHLPSPNTRHYGC